MGKENLGYPGMFPLGKSYALGQWVLHIEGIAPDPSDPSVPADPALFDGFWEAAQRINIDRSMWTKAQYAAFHADALNNIGAVRDVYAAYLANGPLPVDVEQAPTAGMWDNADGVTSERHVYFYANQSDFGTQHGGMASAGEAGLGADCAKYLQIQGFTVNVGTPAGSNDPGAWVLPRRFSSGGQQVLGWRYDADHAGPPYDNTKWIATFSFSNWYEASQGDILTWTTVIMSIIIVVATWGAGTPAAIASIAAAAGVAAAEATAIGIAVAGMLDSLLIGAMKYAVTGDSTALMSALASAGSQLASLATSPGAIQALESKFPDQAQFLKNVSSQISTVVDDAKAAISQTGDTLGSYVQSAEKLAVSTFPAIDNNYWNLAKQAVGGQFAPGSYFMNLARMAPDIDSLKGLAGQIPWYAQGFLEFGATVRAAELGQTAAYLKMTGGGMQALPQSLVPLTPLQKAMQVQVAMTAPRAMSSYAQAHVSLNAPVAPTKSPDQIVKESTPAKSGSILLLAGVAAVLAKLFGLF